MQSPARFIPLAALLLAWFAAPLAAQDEPVFSGPQVGEKLTSFKVQGVFDDAAGKEFDPVADADGKPIVLIFVHGLTRPSVATTRAVLGYAAKQENLTAGLVFLSDDMTAMEERLKRARHALPKDVPVGISVDGQEGPGAYGLNRKMTLTVLVGNENRVTGNFPLVQPSVQADSPKIAAAIAKVLGVDPPQPEELGAQARPAARPEPTRPQPARPAAQDPNIRTYVAPVIQKTATKEEVDEAVAALEKYLADHPATRVQIGDIARRIIGADKLENYGTPHAQEYLKKWAKEWVPPQRPQAPQRRENKNRSSREAPDRPAPAQPKKSD